MTLYTSDIDTNKLISKHLFWNYWTASMLCLLFGAIYELFSNEVYSYFMLGAFLIPLVLGAIPFFILSKIKKTPLPPLIPRYIYHSGVVSLTCGSVVQGVLDIYGTTNRLIYFYFNFGMLFCGAALVISIVWFIIKSIKTKLI